MVNAGFVLLCLAGVLGGLSAELTDGWYTIRCNTKTAGLKAWAQKKFDRPHDGLDYYVGVDSPGDNDKFHFRLETTGVGNFRIIQKTSDGTERSAAVYGVRKFMIALQDKSDSQKQNWFVEDINNGKYRISCDAIGMGRKYVEAYGLTNRLVLVDDKPTNQDQLWTFKRVAD